MTLKSQNILYDIWFHLSRDLDSKTIETIQRRSHEGQTFFTKTLPTIGKAMELGLEEGYFNPRLCPFKKKRGLIAPFYELLCQIFSDTGVILKEPSVRAIRDLRQFTLLYYKYDDGVLNPSVADEAALGFEDRDNRVKRLDYPITRSMVKRFQSLFPDDPMDINPQHSNGATENSKSHYERRTQVRFIPKLHSVYGPEYFAYNYTHGVEIFDKVPCDPPARLTFVPKDSRGPRAICMEPPERMYIQKGLQEALYTYIERYSIARGQINFVDQTINRDLAKLGSYCGMLSTIDLKDASDMVPWNLVASMVTKEWYLALNATRSSKVSYLNKGTGLRVDISLNKYAPMGSALCFPIEAMVFWTIAREVTSTCYVYGDDLIVPTEDFYKVIEHLEAFGLVVNRQKSLSRGYFRESCGGDYYLGYDISYTRLKSLRVDRLIAFLNEIYDLRPNESDAIFNYIRRNIHRNICYAEDISHRDNTSLNVYYTANRSIVRSTHQSFSKRWNEDLQRTEVKRLTASPVSSRIKKELTGYSGLHDWVTRKTPNYEPFADFYNQLYGKVWAAVKYGSI